MIIEKNGKQVEVGYCCFIGCGKPAEFEITKEVGGPEDYTHACEAHVGALLMEGANRVVPHEGKCPECRSWGHGLPCLTPRTA